MQIEQKVWVEWTGPLRIPQVFESPRQWTDHWRHCRGGRQALVNLPLPPYHLILQYREWTGLVLGPRCFHQQAWPQRNQNHKLRRNILVKLPFIIIANSICKGWCKWNHFVVYLIISILYFCVGLKIQRTRSRGNKGGCHNFFCFLYLFAEWQLLCLIN